MDDVSLSQGGFRLSSISAAVPKGSVTGIIGPNGSGKSTFIKAAARLHVDRKRHDLHSRYTAKRDDGAGNCKGDCCSHADENGHPIDDSA